MLPVIDPDLAVIVAAPAAFCACAVPALTNEITLLLLEVQVTPPIALCEPSE
jgi:hypothetical protein